MRDSPLLIHHHLPKTGGTSLRAVLRDNYEPDEILELYAPYRESRGEHAAQGRRFDPGGWYRARYRELPAAARRRLKCVSGHTANWLAPALGRSWRAFCVLRDPVERVWSLYHFAKGLGQLEQPAGLVLPGIATGRAIHENGWSLADIFDALGDKRPPEADPVDRFHEFFNGQARGILAPWRPQTEFAYWSQRTAEAEATLEEEAIETLERHYVVGVHEHFAQSVRRFATAFGWKRDAVPHLNRRRRDSRPDAETRALILAHNRVDAALHARFATELDGAG